MAVAAAVAVDVINVFYSGHVFNAFYFFHVFYF